MAKAIDPSDIVGKKFGRFLVVGLEKRYKDKYYYKCLCDCGKGKIAERYGLRSGRIKSCGCYHSELSSQQIKNYFNKKSENDPMIGLRFGRLTVIDRGKEIVPYTGSYPYICLCECGETISVVKASLIRDYTTSCGCRRKELSRQRQQIIKAEFNSESLLGLVYNKWTVVEYDCFKPTIGHCFKCQCLCGTIRSVNLRSLQNNRSKSCGLCKDKKDLSQTDRAGRLKFSRLDKRDEILKRDKYKCCLCQQVTDDLEIHHIEPWEIKPELRYNSDNLITLCWDCHFLAHKNTVGQGVDEGLTEQFKLYAQKIQQQTSFLINGSVGVMISSHTNHTISEVGVANVH